MIDGVLLLAHGAAESLAELEDFVTRVRDGRPPSAALLADIRQRYERIGGRSPLNEITHSQARALATMLRSRRPVLVGQRYARPFIADALAQAAADGLHTLLALPLAPQYSQLATGRYRDAVESATPAGMTVRFVDAWYDQPRLLDAFAERVRAALDQEPCDAVLFTAHSLPEASARGDSYARQVQATAAGVAKRVHLGEVRVAYQSAARSAEPWLGPDLETALAQLAEARRRRVLAVPIGFVADHTEILYDIDVAARTAAARLGLDLTRSESLNTSPTFIRALAELVDQNE